MRDALGWVYESWERLAVAGRTDTGVHAIGQVASVDVEGGPPIDRAAQALNTALPDDVSVIAAEEAAPDFHARHSARRAELPLPDLEAIDARRRSSRRAATGTRTSSTTRRLRTARIS